jgi:uncharacterized protein (TIGR03437 family)
VGGSVFFDQCTDKVRIYKNTLTGPAWPQSPGLELWGRNIDVGSQTDPNQANTIYGYHSEGISANSLLSPKIKNNITYNNGTDNGTGGILVVTREPGDPCAPVRRDSQDVQISGNSTSPGIFTVGQNGSGQGAILNSDIVNPNPLAINSVNNPAVKGSAIAVFATGAGLFKQAVADGSIFLLPPFIATAAPVSVTIGGRPATVQYAGAASYLVSGVLQVNAIVPNDIGSGPQPIVLTVGQNSNSQQNVTVAIQ